MKHKKLFVFLLLEALLCIVLSSLQELLPDLFPTLSAFPFTQLGLLLRTMSLSGGAGNAVSIVLYVLLCLLPAACLLLLRHKGPLHPEDSLLALLSLALFPVLWLMVNPARLGVPNSEGVFCGVLWSLAASWLALRVLRSLFSSDRTLLQVWFSRLLRAAAVYYVFEISGVLFPALLEELRTMRSAAEGLIGGGYSDTEFHFTVIKYIVSTLPSLLTIFVMFHALELLDEVKQDSDTLPETAQKLSRLCGTALTASILSIAFLNLLQLLLHEELRNIHVSIVLPVTDLALVLGVLLISRYIAENKQLRDDNDLFI